MVAQQTHNRGSQKVAIAARQARVASPEALFRGLLAALAAGDHTVLKAGQTAFHRAFYRVVQELQSGRVSLPERIDFREVDFDPLYGLSGWLDLALTRAQRDSLVSFANPSYRRIEIRYTRHEGQRQLRASAMRQPLEELSAIFLRELAEEHPA